MNMKLSMFGLALVNSVLHQPYKVSHAFYAFIMLLSRKVNRRNDFTFMKLFLEFNCATKNKTAFYFVKSIYNL